MALVHRLNRACSTCMASASMGGSCGGTCTCSSTAGGSVTRSSRAVSPMTSRACTGLRWGGSLRLKVRIWRTRSRARRPAFSISCRLSMAAALPPQSALASSTLPRIAPTMLLKSCAMPPAMVPRACILCDSRSWSSSSLRWASAFLRLVRSRANTVVVSPPLWCSKETLTSTGISRPLAVRAVISPSTACVVSGAKDRACAASGRKRSSGLPSASCGGHRNRAAAVGLKTVMRWSESRQMMASSAELMTDSSRRSLRNSWWLRCCSARRSASSGPWSTTAHRYWAMGGPLCWGMAMQATCRSARSWCCSVISKQTSWASVRPSSRAAEKVSRTRSASSGCTKGAKFTSSRSCSEGWKALCAMALACTTMSCSSTTSRGRGMLANRASKRSEALSATAWL